MQIEDGKLYINRSWKYLYPALRVYGLQPISYLNGLIKQAVGIYDVNFTQEDESPKIFILIQTQSLQFKGMNKKTYESKIAEFFSFIRKQDYYVEDYIYNINKSCCSHMLVLRLPDNFKTIFNHFLKGEYSQMYTSPLVKKYFPLASLSKFLKDKNLNIARNVGTNLEIHKVLQRDVTYQEEFLEFLNRDFGLDLKLEDLAVGMELDYPPLLKEEMFNYKE